MKIAFMSDVHGFYDYTVKPQADVLVIAGDLIAYGSSRELIPVNKWIESSDYQYVVVIAGNHDATFQRNLTKALKRLNSPKVFYLEDSQITIEGITFYGSPWTRKFYDDAQWGFGCKEGHLIEKWQKIPEGVDVLITHMPPMYILDSNYLEAPLGDWSLNREVFLRIKPKIHVFGHIHEGSGIKKLQETTFINAAICDKDLYPINDPKVIEI